VCVYNAKFERIGASRCCTNQGGRLRGVEEHPIQYSSPGAAANIIPKLWIFPEKGYGLVIEDLWVMVCKSPPTELVDQKIYGISGFMGYQSHGL